MNEALFVNAHSRESAVDSVVNRFQDLINPQRKRAGRGHGRKQGGGAGSDEASRRAGRGGDTPRERNLCFRGDRAVDAGPLFAAADDERLRFQADGGVTGNDRAGCAHATLRSKRAAGIAAMGEAIARMENAPAIHQQIYSAATGDEKALPDAVKMSVKEWIMQGE